MNIENNKLFSEFLGNDTDEYGTDVFVPKQLMFNHNAQCMQGIFQFDECYFDTDWNWLMLVVEKIESNLKYVITINSSPTISSRWLSYKILIQKNNFSDILDKVFIVKYESNYSKNESKKEALYNACVEFVKWYNNQK